MPEKETTATEGRPGVAGAGWGGAGRMGSGCQQSRSSTEGDGHALRLDSWDGRTTLTTDSKPPNPTLEKGKIYGTLFVTKAVFLKSWIFRLTKLSACPAQFVAVPDGLRETEAGRSRGSLNKEAPSSPPCWGGCKAAAGKAVF